MPIYEYECAEEGGCAICQGTFTLNRPVGREALERCPLCKKAVRKILSAFSTPKISKPLSISDAKKAGFKIYKKVGKGEYEAQ